MKSRSHSKHRSPKGQEPAGSNIIDLSEYPIKIMPSSNASSSKQVSRNDTNMAKEATATGANTIPLGTGSEASFGRAGAPPKTPNPFSPPSLSIGPRPKRVWQPHLPLFSSEDFEPPRTGEKPSANNNGNNGRTQTATARNEDVITPQTPQERRSFTMTQKCKVLETCLASKDEYLAMPLAPHHDQETFWANILKEKLSPDLASKFKVWKNIKESVEHWCHIRRTLLREGNLPPVSQGQPELDTLVDAWNAVFVTRFCEIHRGYFENGLLAMIENRVSRMVSEHVDRSISSMLQNRRDELESSVRPRLLSNDSSLTVYDNAVKSVQDGFTESKRGHTQAMESEGVLSMVRELRPALEKAITGARQTHQERSGGSNTEPAIHTESAAMRGGPRSNNTHRLTTPSNGSSASASSTLQHPNSQAAAIPLASGNKRPLPDSSELRRTEPVPQVTPNYDDKNSSNNQPKRPRLDRRSSSDVTSRTGFSPRDRKEEKRPQQRQLSPLRRPPASRTPAGPYSHPGQERQNRPSGNLPRDSQYPDRWDGDGEPHRPCQPRGFREDTVEFDNMSTRRQNQLIRTQNRTLLEKLEELGPRSERGPRNNHDSYRRS